MERQHYDDAFKNIAIQRYLNGESSFKIAKDLGIPSPDLIRKWVQAYRKKHGISNKNYRKSNHSGEIDLAAQQREVVKVSEGEGAKVLKHLELIALNEVTRWNNILTSIRRSM